MTGGNISASLIPLYAHFLELRLSSTFGTGFKCTLTKSLVIIEHFSGLIRITQVEGMPTKTGRKEWEKKGTAYLCAPSGALLQRPAWARMLLFVRFLSRKIDEEIESPQEVIFMNFKFGRSFSNFSGR